MNSLHTEGKRKFQSFIYHCLGGDSSAYGVCKIPIQHCNMIDSQKLNMPCALSPMKVYGPFYFVESTASGIRYLGMLEQCLFPQLTEDLRDFILQKDGALPH